MPTRLPVFAFLLLVVFAFTGDGSIFIREPYDFFTTDNLGNVYLVKNSVIRKFDSKGVFQKEFSNKNFGPVTSFDATNPLRLVVFYRDFSRVVFLDNTLSQNGEPVALESLGFPLATLVCSSHDNGLWIYDQQNSELIRFDRNLQVENRTGNITQLTGQTLRPSFLLEADNKLFLDNPSSGALVFDALGTYSQTLPVDSVRSFQVSDGSLYFFAHRKFTGMPISPGDLTVLPVSDTLVTGYRMEKNAFYAGTSEGVKIIPR
ncbi:MAG TPA: hypothetical protein VFU15_06705 [Bacteroidia bacterium]|nr:hypothetical protein [Bacteroidia bacterium]